MNIRLLQKARKDFKIFKNKRTGLFEVFNSDIYFYNDPESYVCYFEVEEEAKQYRRDIILKYVRERYT